MSRTQTDLASQAPGLSPSSRPSPAGPSPEETGFLAELWDWVKSIAVALVLVIVIHHFVFNLSTVKGRSMEPTLEEGEWLFVNKVGYYLGDPERGDIVIFKDPDPASVRPQYLVKRVVGVAGDTIQVHQGQLYRNGKPVVEPYTDSDVAEGEFAPVTVGSGQVFVMGDNRRPGASKDSRKLGTISVERIEGRAQFIFWPVSRWAALGRMQENS